MSVFITDNCTGCTACVKTCPVEAISGTRKERHRVDGQRCIECDSCGRVCPAGAILDAGGDSIQRQPKRELWPKPSFDLARCISCSACADKCPVGCIAMAPGLPGGLESWPGLAAPGRCVACGLCAFYCPADCITIQGPEKGVQR